MSVQDSKAFVPNQISHNLEESKSLGPSSPVSKRSSIVSIPAFTAKLLSANRHQTRDDRIPCRTITKSLSKTLDEIAADPKDPNLNSSPKLVRKSIKQRLEAPEPIMVEFDAPTLNIFARPKLSRTPRASMKQ